MLVCVQCAVMVCVCQILLKKLLKIVKSATNRKLHINSQRSVIAVNQRFIFKGTKIASGKAPILQIHSPDGDTILQTSTTNP